MSTKVLDWRTNFLLYIWDFFYCCKSSGKNIFRMFYISFRNNLESSKQLGMLQNFFIFVNIWKKSLNLLPNGEEWNNLKIWKQFRIWKNIYYKSLENNLKMFSLDKITSLQDTWLLIGSNAIHLIKGRWNPLIIELVPYMQRVICTSLS